VKIASYNVENLFDLEKSDYRYKEYQPYSESLWNKKHYKIKLQNIARVIKDLNADIIALQEIGSLKALKDLRKEIKKLGLYYKHFSIANKKRTVIKVALLSKIPFVYTKELPVSSGYKFRNILEAKFRIESHELYLLVNHWKAKSGPESMRIVSAKKLRKRVVEIGEEKNIILLGDFNSDYEEHLKFKRSRRHNDTEGKTGINHVLKTLEGASNQFYNLWYDTSKELRYSYIYKRKKETLDHIIISPSLREEKDAYYVDNSFGSFKKPYLFKGKKINRWEISRGRVQKHKGKGYSDHLPVSAKFLFRS